MEKLKMPFSKNNSFQIREESLIVGDDNEKRIDIARIEKIHTRKSIWWLVFPIIPLITRLDLKIKTKDNDYDVKNLKEKESVEIIERIKGVGSDIKIIEKPFYSRSFIAGIPSSDFVISKKIAIITIFLAVLIFGIILLLAI